MAYGTEYSDAPWGGYWFLGWGIPALFFVVGYLEGRMDFEALVWLTVGVAALTQSTTGSELLTFYRAKRRYKRGEER